MLKKLQETLINTFNDEKESIKKRLDLIEENPDIKSLSPNCYIVKFEDLNKGILSADYYSNKIQVGYLKKIIDNSQSINSLVNNIEDIVKKGRLKSDENKIIYNDTIRNVLKELL